MSAALRSEMRVDLTDVCSVAVDCRTAGETVLLSFLICLGPKVGPTRVGFV